MATYEEAAAVRDRLADALLDGAAVVSIGIRQADGGYGVGVTATKPLKLPELPEDLHDVDVAVTVTHGGPVVRHRAAVSPGKRAMDWVRSRI